MTDNDPTGLGLALVAMLAYALIAVRMRYGAL